MSEIYDSFIFTQGTQQGDIESTGVLDGCKVTTNTGDASLFDIASGTVQFVDSFTNPLKPTLIQKTFTGATGVTVTDIATAAGSFIAIQNSANNPLTSADILQQTIPPGHTDIRNFAWTGFLDHPDNATIMRAGCEQTFPRDAINITRDLTIAVGTINEAGNTIDPNGANLQLNRTNGTMYAFGAVACDDKSNPSEVTTIQDTALTFVPSYQDGLGNTTFDAETTFLDPEFFDDGSGTLAVMQNNKWQIQRFFIVPRGSLTPDAGLHHIFYGQTIYNSFAGAVQALNTDPFVIETSLLREFHLLAFIIIQQGTLDFTAAVAAGTGAIFFADKFGERSSGGGGGTTNLQQAYNNSIIPQIVTTTALGALMLQRGSAADTDTVFGINNGAGGQVAKIQGDGDSVLNNLTLNSLAMGGVAPVAGTRIILPVENDALTPTLAFGDGDTGIYELSDDIMVFAASGLGTFIVVKLSGQPGFIGSFNGLGAALINETASATNPTIIPRRDNFSTGIGSASAGSLSLITQSIEAISIDASQNVTVKGAFTHQNVTDSTTAFQVLDADGGAPVVNVDTVNERVGFGIAAPTELVHVFGTGTTTRILIENSGGNVADVELKATTSGWRIRANELTGTFSFNDTQNVLQPFKILDGTPTDSFVIKTTELVINEAGGNYDFRVESDNNANIFKVDGGLNRISMGHASTPTALLDISNGTPVVTGTVVELLKVESFGVADAQARASIIRMDWGPTVATSAFTADALNAQVHFTGTSNLTGSALRPGLTAGRYFVRINNPSGTPTFELSAAVSAKISNTATAGGTMTNIAGFLVENANVGTSKTATHLAGFRMLDATGGTVTNQYGVKIEDLSFGTNNWAIHTGVGLVEFGDDITTRGAAVFNEDGGDNDFRVEGDTISTLLTVDASTDRVLVGEGVPGSLFTVQTTTGVTNAEQEFTSPASSWKFRANGTNDVFAIIDNNAGISPFVIQGAGQANVFRLDTNLTVFNQDGFDRDLRAEGDTLTHQLFLEGNAASENMALLAAALPNWQAMDRGIFMGNVTTAPTGNPSAGGFLYVVAGALTWRGSSGTVTTLGAA